jgi:hypothetical protein
MTAWRRAKIGAFSAKTQKTYAVGSVVERRRFDSSGGPLANPHQETISDDRL